MDWVEFHSTTLARGSYRATPSRLRLEFCNGRVYDYFDVPAQIFEELLAAESKGRYFNSHIRNHFRTQEVHARSAGSEN